MTDTLKILGQSYPAAQTLTTAYTVPAATSTTVSSITVCNQATTTGRFRISAAAAGAADTSSQYIYYDTLIAGNDTFVATIGITLATTDVVRVYSSNGYMSFALFGVQLT